MCAGGGETVGSGVGEEGYGNSGFTVSSRSHLGLGAGYSISSYLYWGCK